MIDKDEGIKLLFSDYFEVSPGILNKYGAFNISLVSDLPLFVDPFLLFNSDKEDYKALHDGIIEDIDVETNKIIDTYIQRRYLLEITENSTELNLKIKEGDSVKYACTFNTDESLTKVKWMKNSSDFIEINSVLKLAKI